MNHDTSSSTAETPRRYVRWRWRSWHWSVSPSCSASSRKYGRYVFIRQVMENAAGAGARVAVITPTSYLGSTTANADVGAAITQYAMATVPVQPGWTWTAYQASTSGANTGPWTATPFGNSPGRAD